MHLLYTNDKVILLVVSITCCVNAATCFGNCRLSSQRTLWNRTAKDITIVVLVLRNFRSQWLRGLTRRSAAARLPRLWVRIPPGYGWLFVVSVVWCVVVCDLETTWIIRPLPTGGGGLLPRIKKWEFEWNVWKYYNFLYILLHFSNLYPVVFAAVSASLKLSI
jgi:hypothetical protein